MELSQALSFIRDIPDFPAPGILFKDITPLLAHPDAFASIIDALSKSDSKFSHVVGIEARGFILGAAIAARTETGFIPLRKSGKLPYKTISKSYGLEYGTDVIEAHIDALTKSDHVLIVDDVLATGGTLIAAVELVQELGASIAEVVVLFEIAALNGRERFESKFPNIKLKAIVTA